MDIDQNELIKLITNIIEKELDYKNRNSKKGTNPKEIVIGIGPCFLNGISKTINGLQLEDVIKEICAGIEEENMVHRIVRVKKTSDVAFIGKEASNISGSGIGIGLQSKGTAIIHHKDLYPLTNLELFSQAPLMSIESYRLLGKNSAKYAKGENVIPVKVVNDPMVRPSFQVKAALMHIKETEAIEKNGNTVEWGI